LRFERDCHKRETSAREEQACACARDVRPQADDRCLVRARTESLSTLLDAGLSLSAKVVNNRPLFADLAVFQPDPAYRLNPVTGFCCICADYEAGDQNCVSIMVARYAKSIRDIGNFIVHSDGIHRLVALWLRNFGDKT
jgi:hypothetical protein